MDERSQKRFDELVKLELQEINEDSLKFLFGRRSYMTPTQLEKFDKVFTALEAKNTGEKSKKE